MIAIYIGRFQPPHKGHFSYIKKILSECSQLKIIIGSCNKKNTKENPFTYEERKMMLGLRIEELGLSHKVDIFSAKDYPNENEKWLRQIKDTVGEFDVVYAGQNQLVREIFTTAGYKVKTIGRIDDISSTKIRELIRKEEEWGHLVPHIIYLYIIRINGERRIKKT